MLDRIKHLELLILIYSDRDELRTQQLKNELNRLNMALLESMVA